MLFLGGRGGGWGWVSFVCLKGFESFLVVLGFRVLRVLSFEGFKVFRMFWSSVLHVKS